ncbi:MAG: hypothetical protein WCI18_14735 [Pseudomonadota bacterium]
MVRQVYIFVLVAIATFAVGCNSTTNSYRLEFDQDVTMLLENSQEKSIKRGESLELPIEPMTFTRSDYRTVVLLPVIPNKGSFRIRLPKESSTENPLDAGGEKAKGARSQAAVGRDANNIARAIVEIQILLTEKRADEALVKIQIIRGKYPAFSYLTFLEASCFVVKNDLPKAQSLVEIALKEFPDDFAGRQFLESIGKQNLNQESTPEAEKGH